MAHFPETDSTVYQAQNTLFVSLSSSSAAFWRPAPWARWAAAARGQPGRSPDGAGRGGDGADQAPEVRLRDVDLQRGDLRVERPQRGRGGLLLVVQRRELDLYRRAGEAEGAPATGGKRALGQRGERRPARRAQGLALPCAPTSPNRAPMRVLGPGPPPGPHPTRVPAHVSTSPIAPAPGSSSNSRRCGRGSGRTRPGPEGTSCPLLQVTARPAHHGPESLSVCAQEPSALRPPRSRSPKSRALPVQHTLLIPTLPSSPRAANPGADAGPHQKAPDIWSCQSIQRLSSKSGIQQAPLQLHSLFSQ